MLIYSSQTMSFTWWEVVCGGFGWFWNKKVGDNHSVFWSYVYSTVVFTLLSLLRSPSRLLHQVTKYPPLTSWIRAPACYIRFCVDCFSHFIYLCWWTSYYWSNSELGLINHHPKKWKLTKGNREVLLFRSTSAFACASNIILFFMKNKSE